MSTLGRYLPGESWLHRMPAGPKLLALLLAVTGVVASGTPGLIGAEVLVSAALYPAARVPLRVLGRHVRALLPFVVLILVFQGFTAGWARAVVVAGGLLASVLLAGLVTVTTRVARMLALFERLARPLDRAGVSSRRVALVLALTVRSVPLVATSWQRCRDAYTARGLGRGSWRMVVPVIVGLIRSAEALGDAITARGLDD
ncbi:MAG TPA: energy-coupling factor transporter transmembrane protein EcfT [Pseudonocardiaceae bacterium]|jgi:biotin transport system permease protein|nr:energy-coupling factor transporter transmembrane protein EcfT [Pseudonocardiaceae bacterium]